MRLLRLRVSLRRPGSRLPLQAHPRAKKGAEKAPFFYPWISYPFTGGLGAFCKSNQKSTDSPAAHVMVVDDDLIAYPTPFRQSLPHGLEDSGCIGNAEDLLDELYPKGARVLFLDAGAAPPSALQSP